jgi:hypothetical protein
MAEVRDVSCQTDIHMPPTFDFEKYFADYRAMLQCRMSFPWRHVRRRLFTGTDVTSANISGSTSPEANVSTGFEYSPQSSGQGSSGFVEDFLSVTGT